MPLLRRGSEGERMKVEYIDVSSLKTYANNVKIHTAEQIEQIKSSINEFGFNDPIGVWGDNEVVEGHGRLLAAEELGIEKVPIIRLDHLTNDEKRAYAIVHNRLTTDTMFDDAVLTEELGGITEYDMEQYGFDGLFEFDTNDFYEDVEEKKIEVLCEKCGNIFYIDKNGKVIE